MNTDTPESIGALLEQLPDEPGIYKFFSAKGKILYIGKAKSLRKRVRSYFSGKPVSFRISSMVQQVSDIRYTITNTEAEALLLENNLIKEHQPKYNINLKDGKTYPWICIRNERFPRVFPTRHKTDDGSMYFGPYASVTTMNAILDLIRQNFRLRTCNYVLSPENIASGKFQVCLEFQIGNCAGPCEGRQSEEAYMASIENIRKILRGSLNQLLDQLHEQMMACAVAYQYEQAEEVRRQIERIRQYKQRSTVISEHTGNVSVLGLSTLEGLSIVTHFKVVNGAIIQTQSFEVRRHDEEDAEVLCSALEKLIAEGADPEHTVLSSHAFAPEEGAPDSFRGWEITVPQRGDKRNLVEMALKNSLALLKEKVFKKNSRKETPQVEVMQRLQADLHLKSLPRHIECVDNSNIQGTNPVASLVVFKDGKPSKKDYRHFKIKTVEGPDDFASMEEVVYRRFRRLLDENQPLPDLLIVDGGKGQLSHAAASLEKLGLLQKVPIVGIAKKLEEIYFLNDPVPLHIDKRSPSLRLIQQLRNEAHRFAITFHRDQRSKQQRSTALTGVEGIGEATAQKLLRHFRSVKKVREATLEELTGVVGAAKAGLVREAAEKNLI